MLQKTTDVTERAGEHPPLLIRDVDLARQVIDACTSLASTLATDSATPLPLPPGVRTDTRRLSVVLTLTSWEEVIHWAATLKIDLRDLNEQELAYLERVSVKLVQKWRVEGTGPLYRNAAGIRYVLRDYWEWRGQGRQTRTAEGVRRGRKRLGGASNATAAS